MCDDAFLSHPLVIANGSSLAEWLKRLTATCKVAGSSPTMPLMFLLSFQSPHKNLLRVKTPCICSCFGVLRIGSEKLSDDPGGAG